MRALLLVLALLLAGCATPSSPEAPAPGTVGEPDPGANELSPGPGPVWAFTATDGMSYTSDTPSRNATVLFFMATWCSTCRFIAPMIARVAADHVPQGVAVYSLDFDATETADDLRAWKDRYQQDWPHGIDEGLRIQRHFSVRSQSTVIVLDGAGNVVKHFGYGQASESELRAALDQALAA